MAALLAIRFQPKGADDPGGTIELVFAGGGALRLEVEYIEAELSDLSGEWAARRAPRARNRIREDGARRKYCPLKSIFVIPAQAGTQRLQSLELTHQRSCAHSNITALGSRLRGNDNLVFTPRLCVKNHE